jgi:SAM-dependent methyltransferase
MHNPAASREADACTLGWGWESNTEIRVLYGNELNLGGTGMTRLFFTLALCLSCLAQTPADAERARERWNGRFTDETFYFNKDVNRFLQQATAGLEPGLALDIGMGQGRNTIFLAEKGWQVTGIDVAEEAVAQANKKAAENGLKLHTVVESVDTFDYGVDKWDLVIGMYMHGSITRNAGKIIASVKPGGLLLIEGFHWDQPDSSGTIGFGYKSNELTEVFGELRILYYEDVTGKSDFVSQEEHPIVRLLARKIK